MVEAYINNLVKYIKQNLAKGYTIESLKWALISQGYSRTAIDNAVKLTNEELAKSLPPLKEKPKITIEREPLYKETEIKSEKKHGFLSRLRNFFEN